jgi:hypothetical protein
MFEKFQLLKEASVRAVKRGAEAIKTVSEEVKAAAAVSNTASPAPPLAAPSVRGRAAGVFGQSQLTDEFKNLCLYLDKLKDEEREQETLSDSETAVVRGSLHRIISALCMDNERYLAASFRTHERTNPKDVRT